MDANNGKKPVVRQRERGSVLIVTIWIVLLLASLVIVFSQTIRVEAMAAANHISAAQAEAAADGAINYIFSKLSSEMSGSGSVSASYGANPYEAVGTGTGYFWVIRPNFSDDRNYDYGLAALSGRINLNWASQEMLLKLPAMTVELAAGIIDWRDADSEITAGGAENEYYLLLEDPYYCKNAPLETVEEVLLIKAGDWQSLYGEDLNRNGILDWNENDADKSKPEDNNNGRLDYGFFNFATVNSYEPNKDSSGAERININDAGQGNLRQLIRQAVGDDEYLGEITNRIPRYRNFESVIDLYYVTGMSYEQFSPIVDKLTTTNNKRLEGLVNVNTAPAEVLMCLPGLERSDADALTTKRTSEGIDLSNILWVTQALAKEKAIQIGKYITTKSYQYSADIVAVSGDGKAFRRYYVVIDTADGKPKVIYKQPLYHLGWPLDPGILERLKNGQL